MQFVFVDASGVNPLPPGVSVSVTPLGSESTVASGLLGVGGSAALALSPGQTYVATFSGIQAPGGTQQFTANADGSQTTVVVAGSASPTLSAQGYALEIRATKPLDTWFVDDPVSPVVRPLCDAAGAVLGDIDTESQVLRTALRIESCTGSLIDSFLFDLFRTMLPRLYGETDVLYMARGLLLCSRARLTLAAIQAYVNAYLASTAAYPQLTTPLAEDTSGGEDVASGGVEDVMPLQTGPGTSNNLGEDTQGFEDTQHGGEDVAAPPSATPTTYVFDIQSDPATATLCQLNRGDIGILFKYQNYNLTPKEISPYAPDLDYVLTVAIKPSGFPLRYFTQRYGSGGPA